MENTTGNNKGPAYKCKVGAVEAAVWKHSAEDRSFYNVTVARNYKEESTNTWKATTSFGANDLPKLQLAVSECYRWIMLESKNQETKPTGTSQGTDQAPTGNAPDYMDIESIE